jgi:Common central domain of tyrosinase
MKKREPDDPTSWSYQAAIHGTHSSPLALQTQCEHESWFFFPWHRIYLYYFEQIVRQAVVESGRPADWTLPYWNYGLGGGYDSLPEPFRQPASEANPLFVPVRRSYYNAGGPLPDLGSAEGAALSLREFIGNAMFGGGNLPPNRPRFWGQSGLPEGTPHGTVHVQLGGWMRDPEEAAQDPIFWLHHANIDRIWAVWNEREAKANPVESNWTNHSFEFFDASGNQVAKSCGEVNETGLLGYTYDPPPGGTVGEVTPTPPQPPTPPPGAPSEPKFVGATEEPFSLTGETTEVSMEIDPRAREEILDAADPDDPRHLYVNVEEIRGKTTPDTVYAMYLNLPEEPSPADYESRYLTSLSFFGLERTTDPAGDEAPHGMRVSTEVTRMIKILRDNTDWDRERLRLRFRPVVPEPSMDMPDEARELLASSHRPEHAPIEIGRISLSIDA